MQARDHPRRSPGPPSPGPRRGFLLVRGCDGGELSVAGGRWPVRRRSNAASAAMSRALATGDRGKQNMDVLRASRGRVSVDRLRGMPRIHANARPARAGPARAATRPSGERSPVDRVRRPTGAVIGEPPLFPWRRRQTAWLSDALAQRYLTGSVATGGSSPRMSSGIRLRADASPLISLRRPAARDRASLAESVGMWVPATVRGATRGTVGTRTQTAPIRCRAWRGATSTACTSRVRYCGRLWLPRCEVGLAHAADAPGRVDREQRRATSSSAGTGR